jgi:alpha-galactosidase
LPTYWAGQINDGVVIGLVNTDNVSTTLSVTFSDVPGLLNSSSWAWKECYTGQTGVGTSVSMSLDTHDMAVFKVTKASGDTNTTSFV